MKLFIEATWGIMTETPVSIGVRLRSKQRWSMISIIPVSGYLCNAFEASRQYYNWVKLIT